MFLRQDSKNLQYSKKYQELHKGFLSCMGASLKGIIPVRLRWPKSCDKSNPDIAFVEVHPTYEETLETIEYFINEIKFERFRKRLSPAEKEKTIETFIIPLYEHKKAIYSHAIDYIHKTIEKLQLRPYPGEYKKIICDKYLSLEDAFKYQIKACDEAINDYKPTACVSSCAIL